MRRLAVLPVLLLLVSGCGEASIPTAHVAGTVTIGGAAIPADATGTVSFSPLAGGKGVTVPIDDGHYDSPATPEGKVHVTFSISHAVGPLKKSEYSSGEYRDIENLVPAQSAGGVTITVSGDKLNQEFDL